MSKGGGRRGPAKHNVAPKEDTSCIIFGDGKSDRKAKSREAKAGKPSDGPRPPTENAPKKPDTRQLIGGTSWTGKLPVNLLSEHCQKQKWEKPDYTMVSSHARRPLALILNRPKGHRAFSPESYSKRSTRKQRKPRRSLRLRFLPHTGNMVTVPPQSKLATLRLPLHCSGCQA